MDVDISKIQIDINEVLRYMGVKGAGRSSVELAGLKEQISGIYKEIAGLITPKYLYKEIRLEDFAVKCSSLVFRGSSIGRFLSGVEEGALMAVTLGYGFEQFARRRAHLGSSTMDLIIDAVGTELVEKCADAVENEIRGKLGKIGSSRFSPGYGDFGLEFQEPLLEYIEARRIGVYCNEHFMMFPQKTVTAVVRFETAKGGCAGCGKQDCEFRG